MSSAKRSRIRLIRSRTTRWVLPAASVLVTITTAITVNVLTTDWRWVWWVVLGVLAVANVVVLVRIDATRRPDVSAGGAGSVAAGGDIKGNTTTRASGPAPSPAPRTGGVNAGGPGSVAAGGDIVGDTSTDAR